MTPAEFQEALLDYLEVGESPEQLRAEFAGELEGDLKAYVQSWSLPQIRLAQFLLDKWSRRKS